ncbi:MAG: cell division protein SepF [Erysipelotrichaceae bacterium]|nr:cell division protein SepF [Erysipelotrichaceae bacterium]
MALFKRKTNDYETASRGLNESQTAADKLIIEQMKDDDEFAAKLVDNLKSGSPLILNFDGLGDFAANKMLAFFAGATYACEGKTVKINETTYLFARRVEFLDGSLQRFIQTLPKK